MIIEITPEGVTNFPNIDKDQSPDNIKIFLAGTIDSGDSEDWQNKLVTELALYNWDPSSEEDSGFDYALGADEDEDIIIFNPRRENWNKRATERDVEEQIKWEQKHLDSADFIVMVLKDDSKSPISLLELGLYGPSGKMLVCCTEKFYRFTNIRMTCEKYGIELLETNNIKDISVRISEIFSELIVKK